MRSALKQNGTRAFVAATVVCAALSPAALGAVGAVGGGAQRPPIVRHLVTSEAPARANEGDEA